MKNKKAILFLLALSAVGFYSKSEAGQSLPVWIQIIDRQGAKPGLNNARARIVKFYGNGEFILVKGVLSGDKLALRLNPSEPKEIYRGRWKSNRNKLDIKYLIVSDPSASDLKVPSDTEQAATAFFKKGQLKLQFRGADKKSKPEIYSFVPTQSLTRFFDERLLESEIK